MRSRKLLATVSLAGLMTGLMAIAAGAQNAPALSGQVSSAQEGAMEGVLVSAKKEGSTITTTVVSNTQGHFSFPADRLRARALQHHDPRRRLRACGAEAGGCQRRWRHRRCEARESDQHHRSALQCRMADQCAGRRPVEILPAQLRRLPHAAARVLARCTRPTNGRAFSAAWAAMRRKACRRTRNCWCRAARAASVRALLPTRWMRPPSS